MTRIAILAISVLGVSCDKPEPEKPVLRGEAMGTTWSVKFREPQTAVSQSHITEIIEAIEAEASHWREDSFVSKFNKSISTEPVPCPAHIAAMIEHAQKLHEETDGAFDITVAPFVDLYGFGPPGSQESAGMINLVGSKHLILTETNGVYMLAKSIKPLRIDLSALAKGYAVDRIADALDKLGIDGYLIEFGGELRGRGDRWKIGIEEPDPGSKGKISRTFNLKDQSIATSGTYRLFKKTQKRSHLIDPRTGAPIRHDCPAVTVIADTCMEADALATALMILGPDDGSTFAQTHGVHAVFANQN